MAPLVRFGQEDCGVNCFCLCYGYDLYAMCKNILDFIVDVAVGFRLLMGVFQVFIVMHSGTVASGIPGGGGRVFNTVANLFKYLVK